MIGRTLSHYRILERLGAGGMGEVYLAEDVELRREVALKVLPAEVAADPDRLERFRREARAVASLNHPNIVTVHAVEEDQGVRFLVMERIEGESLEKLLPEGGFPLPELLEIGGALAEALAAAHEKGVTHRDLKPANVMRTADGRIKVLDFGLAKLARDSGPATATQITTAALTREGQIFGTVPYMSPEQLQGKPLDHRTDLFSLGVMLYEMATGRRPFEGDSTAAIISAILRDVPARLSDLRPELPAGLEELVGTCLAKDPRDRFSRASEVRDRLVRLGDPAGSGGSASRTTAGTSAPDPPNRSARPGRRRTIVAAAGLTLLAAAAFLLLRWAGRPDREGSAGAAGSPATRLRQVTFGGGMEEWSAWSPQGTEIVYSADVGGFRNLFLQALDGGQAAQVTSGAADDIQAVWPPGGTELLFVRARTESGKLEPSDLHGYYFDGGDIWSLDRGTGEEHRVLEDAYAPAVSRDGERLAFHASWSGTFRIWAADRRGRNPLQLTTDSSEAVTHASPSWAPDGRKIAFRRIDKIKSDIVVLDLGTRTQTFLTDDDVTDLDPVWSPDGGHVYFPSDRGGGLNIWRVPVGELGAPAGPLQQVTTGAGADLQLAMAPDGRSLTFSVLQPNADIWTLPVDPATGRPTGAPRPLAEGTREESRAVWSPDGRTLAFISDRGGSVNLWLRSAADGSERRLTSGAGPDYMPSWSPDGRSLTFFSARSGNAEVWAVDVEGGEPRQLTDSPGLDINPFFSPDGRRIAFQSDREGRFEIWVMSADGSEPRRVTDVGASGHFNRWTDDGKRVTFRSGVGERARIYEVDVDSGALQELPPVSSGAHMTPTPDRRGILDVAGHKTLWIYPRDGSPPLRVFEFPDPSLRIDYPTWSPDGRSITFDRVEQQGGDIWMLEGLR